MIRKIETKEEAENRRKRNIRIMSIILGIIMLLSTAGYAFISFDNSSSETKSKLKFGDIEFAKTNAGTWQFSYGGNNYQTIYNPNDVVNVSVKITKTISDYYNKPLYFGIDKREDIANNGEYEIVKNLEKIIIKYQFSCLTKNCYENYPIKNCSGDNVIVFKQTEANNSIITENQKCVTISYALGDEERASDALIFGLLGIKKA